MTRRINASSIKDAGGKIAADLRIEADIQQGKQNFTLAHELRSDASTIERIASSLYYRRTSR